MARLALTLPGWAGVAEATFMVAEVQDGSTILPEVALAVAEVQNLSIACLAGEGLLGRGLLLRLPKHGEGHLLLLGMLRGG